MPAGASKPRFSVITPTYNRAHTLRMVYESLQAQTFRNFEWLIVDDGSSDGTRELAASWSADFPIRYFWKTNGGKHTAVNLGVESCHGEWVLFFDSDDKCVATALERFDYHLRQIPDLARFGNVSCLAMTPSGEIVGPPYPTKDYIDVSNFAEQFRYRSAERWGINRTDVLREFPFPEGERFVLEGLIWNRIARKYRARFINEALRIYEPKADSLSNRMVELRVQSPRSTLAYYREMMFSPVPIVLRLSSAVNYLRFKVLSVLRHRPSSTPA